MFKKNNLFFGFSLALIITAVGFGFFYLVNQFILLPITGKAFLRESTLLIAGLAINIFVLNWYLKRHANKTAQGMMIFVFLCAAYIIYTFFGEELGFTGA